MKTFFVAGTDTDIGKTYVCSLLLKEFNKIGYQTFAIKPLATGCYKNKDGNLVSDDALELMSNSSLSCHYETVNPIALPQPIAPNVAADKVGVSLSTLNLCKKIKSSIQYSAHINIIEGIGGWCVPINKTELFSDAVNRLQLPVILVIGIKLGCLNHALLTIQAMQQSGTKLIGWIANLIDPETLYPQEIISTLKAQIRAPCLGVVPYQSKAKIDIAIILKKLHQDGGITG